MSRKTRSRRKATRNKKARRPAGAENVTYISGLRTGSWLVDINWVKERIRSERSVPLEGIRLAEVLNWLNTEGRGMKNATLFGSGGFVLQLRDGKVVAPSEDLSITEIRDGKVVAHSRGTAVKVEGLTPKSDPLSPPLIGQFLLEMILSRTDAANVVGDLAEAYNEKALKYGVTKAKIWFWRQVVGSVRPLVWKAVPWNFLIWLVELLRVIFKN